MKVLPRFVTAFADRHGKVRLRFRKKGLPSAYLPDLTDRLFAKAYDAALRGEPMTVSTQGLPGFQPRRGVAYVYFVGSKGGRVKIGTSRDLPGRLSRLRVANASRLDLLAAVEGGPELERAYHDRFSSARISGEWFARTPEIAAEIRRIRTETCLTNASTDG